MNFRSDNEGCASPEILAALGEANKGYAHSYGDDPITARLGDRFSEIFEHDVAAFPVVSGTAANALALGTMAGPLSAIYCHRNAHIMKSECGAPEFYTNGAKLITMDGADAKITPDALAREIRLTSVGGHCFPRPSAVSLTQATETGTAYTLDELHAVNEVARQYGLKVHMDGARFANALVHLGCSPAEMSWKAGVDALSFGATKNGTLAADAIIFFDRTLAEDFEKRQLRGGHLASKMRFLSAQIEAYLDNDLWLRNATRTNALALRLATAVRDLADVELAGKVNANMVFLRLSLAKIEALRGAGFEFHAMPGEETATARFVISIDTQEEDINNLAAALA